MTAPKERRDATTTTAAAASTGRELDGRALAASLAVTLLELGVTLTASFFFSRWIAKMVQSNNNAGAAGGGGGADGMDGFEADNGVGGGGGGRGGVVNRLKTLLESRYEATIRAAMEELEEDDGGDEEDGRREEKKEDLPPRHHRRDDDAQDDGCDGGRARRHALALREELRSRHEQSLESLETLTPYELSIASNNLIDPSCLTVNFADVGGMDEIKSEIYDLVVMPLMRPDLFVSDSGLVSPPKGILLYG
jgi:hypothetical protein